MRTTIRRAFFAGTGLLLAGCVLPAYEVDESLGGEGGSGGNLPDLRPPPASCAGPFEGGPTMVPVRGGYCIDSTEVTWGQYTEWAAGVMVNPGIVLGGQSKECQWNLELMPETSSQGCGEPPVGEFDVIPVTCIDWCDAALYCRSMGKRLCGSIDGGKIKTQDHADPGQSQWTNACSSGGRNDYPYGDDFKPGACYVGVPGDQPKAIQTHPECRSTEPEYGGVFDLSGNVSEWEDACTNDQGVGDFCLSRGGSFIDGKEDATCTSSRTLLRQSTVNHVGIRCCWDPPPL